MTRMTAAEYRALKGLDGAMQAPKTKRGANRTERMRAELQRIEANEVECDLEADLWNECRKWLEDNGYSKPGGGGHAGRYWHTQQTRRTRQTAGQPDLVVYRLRDRKHFPVELKRNGREKPSDEQQDLLDIGATYRVNTRADLIRLLQGE